MSRLDDLLAGLDRISDDLDELRVMLREPSAAVGTLPPATAAQSALPFAATVASAPKPQSVFAPPAPVSVAEPHAVPERVRRHEEHRERAGFVRKNGQRARLAAVPIALGVALTCVAIVRLPPASTGWTESVTVDSGVGTGQFSCEQLKLTFNRTTLVGTNTKYSYTLTGGGPNPITCKEIVWISLAVCTDFDPTTDVLNETHPSSWTFTPQATELRWTSVSAGSGPLNEEFSFELPGNADPVDTIPRVLLNTPNAQPINLTSHVNVPCPVPAAAPVANHQSITNKSLSNTSNDGAAGGYTGPVAGATPTNTPTPTATPKSGKFDKPVGIAIYPATATPVPTKAPAPTATSTTAAPPTTTPTPPPPPTPTSIGSN